MNDPPPGPFTGLVHRPGQNPAAQTYNPQDAAAANILLGLRGRALHPDRETGPIVPNPSALRWLASQLKRIDLYLPREEKVLSVNDILWLASRFIQWDPNHLLCGPVEVYEKPEECYDSFVEEFPESDYDYAPVRDWLKKWFYLSGIFESDDGVDQFVKNNKLTGKLLRILNEKAIIKMINAMNNIGGKGLLYEEIVMEELLKSVLYARAVHLHAEAEKRKSELTDEASS